MREGTLSQSEIDALLSQGQAAFDRKKTTPATEKTALPYNFRKQKKFNKSQFVVLERIHKRFLRNLEVTLTNLLNSPVMATLAAVTELTYSDCSASFSSPTCLYSLDINHGSEKFLLEVGPNLAFFVIDKILGGNGDSDTELTRELSLIEERIMHRVVTLLIEDLTTAWDKIDEFNIEIDGFYPQSDYVQTIAPTDSVILVAVDIRNAEKVLGYLNLCFPCSALELLLQGYERSTDLQRLSSQENTEDRRNLEHQMRHSILPVRAILGETEMKVREVLRLKEGDVLFLHSEVNQPIDVLVGDLRLYKGLPLKKDKSITVKIEEVVRLDHPPQK
ncbi:FliM/FliN family flagellar motor switch protein [bacterium]|nr:FliM/FliN family flagellar motor switch protein [bacterium]